MDDFIIKILDNHKKFLASGKLLDVKERKRAIKNLKKNIDLMKNEIFQALKLDLNKSEEESYMTTFKDNVMQEEVFGPVLQIF